jgi:hypothetical protein
MAQSVLHYSGNVPHMTMLDYALEQIEAAAKADLTDPVTIDVMMAARNYTAARLMLRRHEWHIQTLLASVKVIAEELHKEVLLHRHESQATVLLE